MYCFVHNVSSFNFHLRRGSLGEGEVICEWKGAWGTLWRGKGQKPPLFYCPFSWHSPHASVISSPQLLNCQPTLSRQHEMGLCCGESSYIDLCFRLWTLQQAGLYWRKSNQQTCSLATDWSVILTETQQCMGTCTTSPQRALYLEELCVMRCGAHYN